jgi:hypothetical protein
MRGDIGVFYGKARILFRGVFKVGQYVQRVLREALF